MLAQPNVAFDATKAQQAWSPPMLSVIVPSYNERDNLELLYSKVDAALAGTPFEFVVVDDNSPDGSSDVVKGMAQRFDNVRCLRRVGRRGLTSAVIEGICSSSAPFVAVIDADLQHDETILPIMLKHATEGAEIVVGTRYTADTAAGKIGGFSEAREKGSRVATRLSSMVAGEQVSDPMSGFFLMRRALFDQIVPTLGSEGFKILLDIVVSASRLKKSTGETLRIAEVPYVFRSRHAGESKMSPLVVVQFLGLVLSQLTRGVLPPKFLLFSLVGGVGLVVHLFVLGLCNEGFGLSFVASQTIATLTAMTFNFVLNNEFTYADKALRGSRFWTGLMTFYVVCSIGALANVSVASWLYQASPHLFIAGIAGALMSVVFNYSVTQVFTWR